jgi:hypothetical protein
MNVITMNTQNKQKNAAGSRFLKGVKLTMNAKIYARTRTLLNSEGQEAAIAYLQRFFNKPITAATFEEQEILQLGNEAAK